MKSKLRGAVSIFTDTTVEELKNRVEEACSEVVFLRQRIQEGQKEKLNGVSSDSLIIGQSYAHLDLMERATIVAETDLPVLIKGENGVGKEVVARYIHKKSFRSNKPFIVVNCAAIPDNLVESELFGYEAGSFTGAKTNGKAGKFELANGGTLFLDEIGDMPLTMQTKLLRSLEYQEIEKIGSEKMVSVDVRIISATNQDLEKMIGNKTFRKDLFYRINTISLIVPPLRNRREDVGLFINYFLRMMNSKYNKEVRLSDDAFSLLHNHNWPGNVRELRNFIESAVVMNNNNLIDNKTLYDYFGEQINSSAKNMAALSKNETFIPIKLEEAMDDTEKNLLIMTLKACNNNKTEAMEILGVSRRTFYRKLSKHDLI